MPEFTPFPKIARLNREIVVTEKIDGTNAAVGITEDEVYAQSRNRIITPEQDNHGFARWVADNADSLRDDLGLGLHFGEWWGSGIQRGYGLQNGEKRFSLFNTTRWGGFFFTHGLAVVPELYRGDWDQDRIDGEVECLRKYGSVAAPGFPDPEGVVVYHTAANLMFKVTLKNDEKPKGQVA